MAQTNTTNGSLVMVAGMGLYMFGDVFLKFVFGKLPIFEIQALRGLASVVVCLLMIFALGQWRQLVHLRNPWLLSRGFLEVVSSFSFYAAITHLPLADVTAIVQTCPLIMSVAAWAVWGEKLGWKRVALVLIGILGALLVAQPGSTAASGYALLGFVVAFALVGRDLFIRKMPAETSPLVAVLPLLVIVTLAATVASFQMETPVIPDATSAMHLTISGVVVVLGHSAVFLAYRLAPARSVAPFMYTLTVWAIFFGAVIFGDIPNALAIAGMAIIIAAGLAIIWLDAKEQTQKA
jgi:drug/metabolite transporter (DMT)-like permease